MVSGNDVMYDTILGELREADLSGGTGGTAYEAGPGIDGVALEDGVIAVSGLTATVSGTTATITPKGSTVGVKVSAKDGVNLSGSTTGEIELDAKDLSDGTQSVSKDLENARHIAGATGTPLTLLHFSDIHADSAALTRIIADKTALGALVDGAICTGDMTANVSGQISSWWNSSVMTCIGNHDTASQSGTTYNWTALSMADRDSYYIAPVESNWGVMHTSGTSYYYKDYSTQKLRLIVMDVMLYMSNSTATEAAAQTAWLESLLEDAVTNELHVLIAVHAPHGGSIPVKCSFTLYNRGIMPTNADCNTPDAVINAVAAKILAGLHFVGYLCGHIHQDVVWDVTGDGTQYMYCVTTANVATKPQWQNADLARSTSLDAFNLVSIDTVHSLVKIVRGGGANIDNLERAREGITINYSNGYVIDRERPLYAQSAGTAESATIADSATVALGAASSMAGYRMEVEGGTMSMARFFPIETVTGASVTLMAGYAYRVQTSGTAVTLNTENIPANSWGLDGHIDIFTTSSDLVVAGENVRFNDSFSLNAWNSCTVRFASGIATVYVDNRVSTYIVIQNTDLTTGSLYFGLTDSSVSTRNYINIDSSLDGQTLSLSGATVTSEKHILGNGVFSNTLTGSVGVGAGGYLDMTDCALSAVTFTEGNAGVGDVAIPNGATVTVASGKLAIGGTVQCTSGTLVMSSGTILDLTGNQNASIIDYSATNSLQFADSVTVYPNAGQASSYVIGVAIKHLGNTNVIDFNHQYRTGSEHDYFMSNVVMMNGYVANAGGGILTIGSKTATATDCIFSNGYAGGGNGGLILDYSNGLFNFTSCTITGCTASGNGGAFYKGTGPGVGVISSCYVSGNRGAIGGAIGVNGNIKVIDCEIVGNTGTTAGGAVGMLGSTCELSNSYIHGNNDTAGAIYLSNAAKIVITGSTIAKGQRINLYAAGNSATFAGSNIIGQTVYGSGHAYISSGAIIDLTGNTNATVMNPAGGIVVSTGGCTVIAYDGTTVSLAAGTYASIKNDGSAT